MAWSMAAARTVVKHEKCPSRKTSSNLPYLFLISSLTSIFINIQFHVYWKWSLPNLTRSCSPFAVGMFLVWVIWTVTRCLRESFSEKHLQFSPSAQKTTSRTHTRDIQRFNRSCLQNTSRSKSSLGKSKFPYATLSSTISTPIHAERKPHLLLF